MRIDSHVHVWTLGVPPFIHNDDMSTQRPEYPGLVEDLIRYMDLNKIDRTVLIQCMYHGYDNSYMCDCLRRFPDRLHGVALINPNNPTLLKSWKACIESKACRGCACIQLETRMLLG